MLSSGKEVNHSVFECISKLTKLISLVTLDLRTSTEEIATATGHMMNIMGNLDAESDLKAQIGKHNAFAYDIITAIQVDDRIQQVLSHLVSALSSLQAMDVNSCEAEAVAKDLLAHLSDKSSVDYERGVFADSAVMTTKGNNDSPTVNQPTFF